MKLTNLDKDILELLKEGATMKTLHMKTGKFRQHLWLRLNKMMKHGIIEKIGKSPALYKINLVAKNELVFLYVECPKCKSKYRVHHEQATKQCNNCFTKTGKKTRFYIYDKRITDSIRII